MLLIWVILKKKLKELYTIRLSIEQLNSTPINPSVKLLINIANKCDNLNEKYIEAPHSNQSFDEEYIEVPHSSEKSSDYFKFLKYTIPHIMMVYFTKNITSNYLF